MGADGIFDYIYFLRKTSNTPRVIVEMKLKHREFGHKYFPRMMDEDAKSGNVYDGAAFYLIA